MHNLKNQMYDAAKAAYEKAAQANEQQFQEEMESWMLKTYNEAFLEYCGIISSGNNNVEFEEVLEEKRRNPPKRRQLVFPPYLEDILIMGA